MKMKKLTALLLATLMVLSLAACGAKGDSKTENSGETATDGGGCRHPQVPDGSGRTRSCRRTRSFGKRSFWRRTRAWP